ncbi:hypothetical protein [Halovivax limisalsi]|uniref:hypothetical protein n=1 Tax=Halovivax limisalsi TaxID=1453760 RepID=UPI001FFD2FE4|nr:hypothetical protein [Halovivax limisalsi]
MAEGEPSSGSERSTRHVALFVFGVMATIFVLLPETRSATLVLLWLAAPLVAFGSLVQVIRGTHELRSGRGLIFAMACAVLAVGSLPLGVAIAASTLADVLWFFGLTTALVAVGIARLSVVERGPGTEREVPSPEELAAAATDEPVLGVDQGELDDTGGVPAQDDEAN